MRQTPQFWEPGDNLFWMEEVAKGVIWAEAVVVALLSFSLLMIGTGLYPLPVLTEGVLRGLLGH